MHGYQQENERQRYLEARKVRKVKSRQNSIITKVSAFGMRANSVVH